MSADLAIDIKELDYWLRLGTFLHEPLNEAIRNVVHNTFNDPRYVGLPEDASALYIELDTNHKKELKKLLNKGIINQDQYDILLPNGKKETRSSDFDVTTMAVLIRNCLPDLPIPIGGWKIAYDNLDPSDTSLAAYVIKGRKWRNKNIHKPAKEIDKQYFDDEWRAGEEIVTGLRYTKDTKALKTIDLDPSRGSFIKAHYHYLRNRQDQNSEELAKLREELQKVVRPSSEASEKMVLNSVIDITCSEIKEDWRMLATKFKTTKELLDELETSDKSTREKMKEVFDAKGNITWNDLKFNLQSIDKSDIVKKLKSETLLTVGLENASLESKNMYKNKLQECAIADPLMNHDGRSSVILDREKAFVDLAILETSVVNDNWLHNDIEYHKQTSYLKRENIKLENIFEKDDQFVIARGVAGIGKSMLTESYALKWANNSILVDPSREPKIDFLFKLTCRDLNESDDVHSMEALLLEKFPEVFKSNSLEDLRDVSDRVMILLDGVDELKDIDLFNDKSNDKNTPNMIKFVRNLLYVNWNVLPQHKTFVAGRPEASGIIKAYFSSRRKVKFIEICGFNEDNVQKYIEIYCETPAAIVRVKNKIQESDNLKLMSTIPVYLWVICRIFSDENNRIEAPKTITELCGYACLIFIRNHGKIATINGENVIDKDIPLGELIDNRKKVVDIIYALAELSKSTLQERKVVFDIDRVQQFSNTIKIEDTGFIYKHRYNDGKPKYQFKHLVLQEFLASLSLYLRPGFLSSDFGKPCFKSCVPMVAGLCGIEKTSKCVIEKGGELNPVQKFLEELRTFYKNISSWKKIVYVCSEFRKTYLIKHIEYCLSHQMQNSNNTMVIDGNFVDNLTIVYEYQGEFSKEFKRFITDKSLEVRNIVHHIDIRNTLYFIEKSNVNDVTKIDIKIPSDTPLPANIIELFQKFYKKINKDHIKTIWLCGESKSSGIMEIQDHIEKTQECIKEGIKVNITTDKHVENGKYVLPELLLLVDKIILDTSLGSRYLLIKDIILETDKRDKERDILRNVHIPGCEFENRKIDKVASEKLEMNIDANFLYICQNQESKYTLQIEHAQILSNAFDENLMQFRIGLPVGLNADPDLFQIFEKVLKKSLNLDLFDKLILKRTIHPKYPEIKRILREVNFSLKKLVIEREEDHFRPSSSTNFEYGMDAHLLPGNILSNDSPCNLRNILHFHVALREHELTVDVSPIQRSPIQSSNGKLFVVKFMNAQTFDYLKGCIRNVVHHFERIEIDDSLGTSLRDNIKQFLISTNYPADNIIIPNNR